MCRRCLCHSRATLKHQLKIYVFDYLWLMIYLLWSVTDHNQRRNGYILKLIIIVNNKIIELKIIIMAKPIHGDNNIDQKAKSKLEEFRKFFAAENNLKNLDLDTIRELRDTTLDILPKIIKWEDVRIKQKLGGIKGNSIKKEN